MLFLSYFSANKHDTFSLEPQHRNILMWIHKSGIEDPRKSHSIRPEPGTYTYKKSGENITDSTQAKQANKSKVSSPTPPQPTLHQQGDHNARQDPLRQQ